MKKQIELENSDLKQQINFIGRLERNKGATMLFITEKKEEKKPLFDFSQNSVVGCLICIKWKLKDVYLLNDSNNKFQNLQQEMVH